MIEIMILIGRTLDQFPELPFSAIFEFKKNVALSIRN